MSYHRTLHSDNLAKGYLAPYGLIILPADDKTLKTKDYSKVLPAGYGSKVAAHLNAVTKARSFASKAGSYIMTDLSPTQTVIVCALPREASTFAVLSFAREVAHQGFGNKPAKILVDLRLLNTSVDGVVADAFAAVTGTRHYVAPKYSEDVDKAYLPKIDLLTTKSRLAAIKSDVDRSAQETVATNLVRYLAELPPNKLTCKDYVQRCRRIAKETGLGIDVYSQGKLAKMGAGAFVAVAQGSDHEDAAIVALHYKPKSAQKHISFVGKGLVYDTGGVNVKTDNYMFGMHGDMTGSAVALAMITHAAKQKWPEEVTAYLAIADNAIGNRSYRPNEVIQSLSGKTIEVVNTDAEGRMVLADTLTLATRHKTNLVIDFATLTGSAVRAIGTRFCTGYSNKDVIRDLIVPAGNQSGERVWSFPLDKDLGEGLESDIADTKQCRLSGGVDHIEAAFFLAGFVQNDTPWVHIDLSASENEGGLGHVGSKTTGFGIRFASRLVEMWRHLN